MSLPPKIVKAYVADAVLRQAFCPASGNEKLRWLNRLHANVRAFWGIENSPKVPRVQGDALCGTLEHGKLQILVEYRVEANADIGAKIMFCRDNDRDLLWCHHSDTQFYRFPDRTALLAIGKEKEALRVASPADFEAVVDGLICHPAVHQHVESYFNQHEIRIGGGIGNAFLFLFHMRFQLCPFPEQRLEERSRLARIFSTAVREDRQISANELFGNVG